MLHTRDVEKISFEGRLLTPEYDNPAALGGSFVVAHAMRLDTTSGSLPIINPDHILAGPSSRPTEIATVSPTGVKSRAKPRAMKASLNTSCVMLFDLIEESLGHQTKEEWLNFWGEHLHEYSAIARNVSVLREKLEEGIEQDDATVSTPLAARFPKQAAMLRDGYATVAAVVKLTRTFGPVLPKYDAQDLALVRRHSTAGAFYSVCALTLELAAQDHVKIPEPLLEHTFDMFRGSVMVLHETANEAAQLRRASALDELKSELQEVLAEVRAQTEVEVDDELLALANAALSPSDGNERAEDWARRLAPELFKN